jgi:uncharacterized protein
MRVSSYLIAAPIPGQSYYLLLHGYTAAVDKVPASLGAYLLRRRGLEFSDDAEVMPHVSEGTLAHLATRGYLTELDHESERRIVLRIAAAIHEADLASHVATFIIVPTYVCNLRCPYCFQPHGMHAGRGEFGKVLMRERVDEVFAIIDQFSRPGEISRALGVIEPQDGSCPDENHRQRDITLFGGEPLLERTVDVVSYIVEGASRRNIPIAAISNGLELQRFRHLLGPGRLEEIQITLDGPAHIHDERRIGPGHRHTFDTIAANVDMALAHDVRIALRINVNSENAEHLESLHNTFVERGWEQHPNFRANAATVHGAWLPRANRNLISSTKLVELTTRLRKTRRSRIDSYESVARRTLNNCIQGKGYPFQSSAFCAAETGMLIFDPLGDVYACWEEIGQPDQRIGTYSANGIDFSREALGPWLARFPGAIEECSNCPYALIHKSGCAHQARKASKTMFAPACSSFQDYFPTTLADAYADEERRALEPTA